MVTGAMSNGRNGEWLKWIVRLAVVAWAGFITVEALAARDFRNRGDSFTRGDAAEIEKRLNTLENRGGTMDGRLVDIRQDLAAMRVDIDESRRAIISGFKQLTKEDERERGP